MLMDQYIAEVKSHGSSLQEDEGLSSVFDKFAECATHWTAHFSISYEDLVCELTANSSNNTSDKRHRAVST